MRRLINESAAERSGTQFPLNVIKSVEKLTLGREDVQETVGSLDCIARFAARSKISHFFTFA